MPRTAYSSTSRTAVRPWLPARRQPGVLGPASLHALAAIVLTLVVSALPVALAAQSAAPELAEGRRLFDALEYEQAMPFLDQAIAALEPDAARDAPTRAALISALEMRARARFGMGNQEGAVADFRSLLALDPGFALDPSVSPRVVAMLDEVRTATIGTIELTLDPGRG